MQDGKQVESVHYKTCYISSVSILDKTGSRRIPKAVPQ